MLRWLIRFLLRALAVLAAVAGLLVLVIAAIYYNRVRLVNETLAILVEPFHVAVGEIELHRPGRVRIGDLRLVPKGGQSDRPLAFVPETIVTYRFDELRKARKLRHLVLRGAEVSIDQEILAAVGGGDGTGPESGGESGPAPSLSAISLFTGSIRILESRFSCKLEHLPKLEGSWELRCGPFEFDKEGLSAEPAVLSLSDLVVGEGGRNGTVRRISAAVRPAEDLSRLEFDSLRLVGPRLHITPDLLSRAAPSPPQPAAAPADRGGIPSLRFGSIEIALARIASIGFDGREGRPLIPDFGFDLDFACEDLSLADGSWSHTAPLNLTLRRIGLGAAAAPLCSVESASLACDDLGALLAERRIPPIRLDGVDVLVEDDSLAWLRLAPAREKPAEAPPGAPWTLSEISIREGKFLLRDLAIGETAAPTLATSFSATLRELRLGGEEGFASEAMQRLDLARTSLRAPGAAPSDEALLSLDSATLALRWPELLDEGLIASLSAKGPVVHFTDESLGDWLDGEIPAGAPTAAKTDRPVYKVADLSVEGGRLVADSRFAEGRVPKIHASFSLSTDRSPAAVPHAYDFVLRDFEIRNHARALPEEGPPAPGTFPLAEEEVFRIDEIHARFTAEGIQRTRRIERLRLEGGALTVGEGLKSLLGDTSGKTDTAPAPEAVPHPAPRAEAAPAAPANEPSAPAARALPPWVIGEVEVARSQVRFDALLPEIEGLQFQVQARLSEVPLSIDGILAQDAMQKIELAEIEIKDPYNSFITVAELPTIFVEFSLAGLARQEIEKIDLVGPSLHVGQGLFWWIDYQRKYREANEGARVGIESPAAPQRPDWLIRTIEATAGKIVIAPTGIPLGVVPFPFNATTRMTDGEIELKLNIPDENHVYRFPDFKVELEGLVGEVQFNVPVKDEDNNLVQTFTLKRAKWKDFDAEDLYITVTFDAAGIYGLFGGATYGGYAEGGFNFYLEDAGKWDAWVAGSDLGSGPITALLAPENFLMDGDVSLKLVTEGRDKTLGRTTGEIRGNGPGWLDIAKLGELLERLPPEWSPLQRRLTEISVETLRRFDYDEVVGSLSFLDLEGALQLRFDGPYGVRELSLNLHDEREDRIAEAPGLVAPAPAPAPLPEASAQPVAPGPPASQVATSLRRSKR